jgi:putative ABC transport system ATP-binding protein
VTALAGVDLTLRAGQVIGVVGRSGSGKTTLLTLAGLLDRPDGGRLVVDGRETHAMSSGALARWRRGRIGFLFQDAGLIERMSVMRSVTLPLAYAGVARRERRRRAEEALAQLGLFDKASRSVSQLSGGERQRVGLARAIALQPRLLICDEPTAALDGENARLVARALREQADAGAAGLAATHDEVLKPVFDEVLALEAGRVSAEGLRP